MHIPTLLERQSLRCPVSLVDVACPGPDAGHLTGAKAVSASEEYFQGHFPGAPLMPGVLMIEALTQASTLMLLGSTDAADGATVRLRGVDDAKFRRHVVPGDRLDIDVQLVARRGPLARVQATARVDGAVVIEARLVLLVTAGAPRIHPTAIVDPAAVIGDGSVIGPGAVIGPYVVIGRDVSVGASAVVEGDTTIGDHTRIFPFASIGLPPQDLKYRGERTRLVVGHSNVFRESVTIHRGTVGGGSETRIGDRNLFMAYAHVAHDCRVGSDTIFGPGATLGGHVVVEDFAQISAYSGVHQFCRVGRYAFIGGYSVVTLDALPFAKTVGNRARRVRPEHDRPGPARVQPGRREQAEARLPLPADLAPDAVTGAPDDRRRAGVGVSGCRLSRGLHPLVEPGRDAPAAQQARRRRRGLAAP